MQVTTEGSSLIFEERSASVIDASHEAAAVVRADGTIVSWNRAAERTFGWTAAEALGGHLSRLLGSQTIGTWLCDVVAQLSLSGEPLVVVDGAEVRAAPFGGRERLLHVAASAVQTAGGSRFVVFMDDVSERREAALGRQRFEAIVASSADAIFSSALGGTIESWNAAAERLYGYSAAEIIGSSAGKLRPDGNLDDLAYVAKSIAQGRAIALETRDRRKDGTLVDVAVTLSPLRDDDGAIHGVVSVIRDITERNHATTRLQEANSRFARAFEAASTGMALVARDGRYLDVNPALCRMLERDRETLLGCSFVGVTHPDDVEQSAELIRRSLTGEIDGSSQTKRYLLPDGGIIWGLTTFTVARSNDGAVQHFITQTEDITGRKTAEFELQRYASQLQSLSQQDPLTGLLNHQAFQTALEEKLRVLNIGGAEFTVLLVKVAGEQSAIITAADALVRASRGGDLIARVADQELAVLLTEIDDATAGPVIQRITEDLRDQRAVSWCHAVARPSDNATGLMRELRERLPQHSSEPNAPPATITRLLELARQQLGTSVAFLARIDNNNQVFETISGTHAGFDVHEGDVIPTTETLCQRMLDHRIAASVPDLAAHLETRQLEVIKTLNIRAYAGVPIHLRSGELYGTLCAVDPRPHPELTDSQTDLLKFLAELAGDLIEQQTEQQAARRLETSATGVRTLLTALEARDLYTGEHSKQVVALASTVARRLGLPETAVRDVEQVALLHDIGKVGIPDAILQKQGPLDDQEWQLMRQHPIVGERIIAGTPGLAHLAPAMRAEHERWDGTGYPDGLVREAIPIASRITLACDALHAMTSHRPYRPVMTLQHARHELQANAGTQFDPKVTQALLAELPTEIEPNNPPDRVDTLNPGGASDHRHLPVPRATLNTGR